MGFLIFCLSVGMIVLWYFIGKEFEMIADRKGFDGKHYFWWCFLFPPAGMLMVIALPDYSGREKASPVISDELPDL